LIASTNLHSAQDYCNAHTVYMVFLHGMGVIQYLSIL